MLTRFEEARVIAARALQVSMGAPVLLEGTGNLTRSDEIAENSKKEYYPCLLLESILMEKRK